MWCLPSVHACIQISLSFTDINCIELEDYATFMGFPGGSDNKESPWSAGNPGQSLSWEDLLEKGMATHSSILAWRIPWIEEPGGLQSIGSQRVWHNWAPNTFTFFFKGQKTKRKDEYHDTGMLSLGIHKPSHLIWRIYKPQSDPSPRKNEWKKHTQNTVKLAFWCCFYKENKKE